MDVSNETLKSSGITVMTGLSGLNSGTNKNTSTG